MPSNAFLYAIVNEQCLCDLHTLIESASHIDVPEFYDQWEDEILDLLKSKPDYDELSELPALPSIHSLMEYRLEWALAKVAFDLTGGESFPALEVEDLRDEELTVKEAEQRLNALLKVLGATAPKAAGWEELVELVNASLPPAYRKWLKLRAEELDSDEPTVELSWEYFPNR